MGWGAAEVSEGLGFVPQPSQQQDDRLITRKVE